VAALHFWTVQQEERVNDLSPYVGKVAEQGADFLLLGRVRV
jgi:hypothetical protein